MPSEWRWSHTAAQAVVMAMVGHGCTFGHRARWMWIHVVRERTVSVRTSSLSAYVLDLARDMPIELKSWSSWIWAGDGPYRAYFLVTEACTLEGLFQGGIPWGCHLHAGTLRNLLVNTPPSFGGAVWGELHQGRQPPASDDGDWE